MCSARLDCRDCLHYQAWVLKKSLNRTPFHLRGCRRRFSSLGPTKWSWVEPVLLAD